MPSKQIGAREARALLFDGVAFRKTSILVVDDRRANLLAVEAVLGDDYEVVCANSGAEALRVVAQRSDIDLILMDVQMPELDGFETAQRIKRMPAARDKPIIFVTAIHTDAPFIRRGYEVGGIDYFSKPFDPEILKHKVAAYAALQRRDAALDPAQGEPALQRAASKLARLLEALPLGVLIADVDGRLCHANERASRILNTFEAADAYGEILGWWDRAGEALRNHDGPLSRALQGADAHRERLEIRRFNGAAQAVLVSACALRGLEGRIVGALLLIQDPPAARPAEEEWLRRAAGLVSLGIELEECLLRQGITMSGIP